MKRDRRKRREKVKNNRNRQVNFRKYNKNKFKILIEN